jgi:GPI mannosyltransferase 4
MLYFYRAVLVFYSRPFSNTMEAFCLAYSLAVYLLCETSMCKRVTLGFLLAFGVFTRFTFVAFFLPIGISLLMDSLYIASRKTNQRTIFFDEEPSRFSNDNNVGKSPYRLFLIDLSQCIGGSLAGTFLNIVLDSMYYDGKFTVTPLNNAIYNMQTENLAKHGLHPRYLHFIVNLPMLCGPLTLYLYYYGFFKHGFSIRSKSSNRKKKSRETIYQYHFFTLNTLLIMCVCSGLFILSLAPHQEARFLLPLVFPIILFYSINVDNGNISSVTKKERSAVSIFSYKRIQYVWMLFNVILFLLFGVFHQAGVLKALNYAANTKLLENRPKNLIFYHTYMPPRFMLLNKMEKHVGKDNVHEDYINVVDVGGNDIDKLISSLEDTVISSDTNNNKKQRNNWVVAPASLHIDKNGKIIQFLNENRLKLEVKTEFYPHLSMEDLPSRLKDLSLVVYRIYREYDM